MSNENMPTLADVEQWLSIASHVAKTTEHREHLAALAATVQTVRRLIHRVGQSPDRPSTMRMIVALAGDKPT